MGGSTNVDTKCKTANPERFSVTEGENTCYQKMIELNHTKRKHYFKDLGVEDKEGVDGEHANE